MKRLGFSIVMVLLLVGQITFAQGKRGGKSPKKHLEQLKSELNLSDAQVADIKKIGEETKEKMIALKKEEGDWESKKEAFKKLKEEKTAAFEKVLTPEQLEKFTALKAEKKEKMKARKAEMKEKRKAMRAERKKITPEQRKAIRTETQQYITKNVLPVLQKQRAKLDKQMVAADRTQVEELRGIVKTVLPQMKEKRKKMMKERKAKKETFEKMTEEERKAKRAEKRAAMKKEHGAKREKYKAHFETAKTLTEKYSDNIQKLQDEISTDIEKWKTDIKAIAAKHGVTQQRTRGRKPMKEDREKIRDRKTFKKGKKRGKRGKKFGGMHHGMMHKHFTKVGFLLLDPNEDYTQLMEEMMGEETIIDQQPTRSAETRDVKVYPNPSVAANTLDYEVLEAGEVTVELRSKEGALIRTLVNETKEAGNYSIQVNLADLNNNVYYYVIRDKQGQTTKKFVLHK